MEPWKPAAEKGEAKHAHGVFQAETLPFTRSGPERRSSSPRGAKVLRAPPGIEPGTSCTRSKNHTTRPRSRLRMGELGIDPSPRWSQHRVPSSNTSPPMLGPAGSRTRSPCTLCTDVAVNTTRPVVHRRNRTASWRVRASRVAVTPCEQASFCQGSNLECKIQSLT